MREKTTNTANRGNKKKKHHQQTRSQTSSSFFFFSFVFVSLLVREHRQRIRSLDYHQVALIQLISDTFPVAWRHGRPAVWFRWAFPLVPIDSRTIAVSRYQITVEKRWNIKLDVISNSCRNSYLHLRVPVRDKNDSHKSLHCAKRVCFLNIWQLDCRDAQVAWNAKEGSRAKDQNRFKVLATAK